MNRRSPERNEVIIIDASSPALTADEIAVRKLLEEEDRAVAMRMYEAEEKEVGTIIGCRALPCYLSFQTVLPFFAHLLWFHWNPSSSFFPFTCSQMKLNRLVRGVPVAPPTGAPRFTRPPRSASEAGYRCIYQCYLKGSLCQPPNPLVARTTAPVIWRPCSIHREA
jgi:hypothetical protein